MIYKGSNVDFDEFENSAYVTAPAGVFGTKADSACRMELVETSASAPALRSDDKAPGSLRGLVALFRRYWLISGMLLASFGFGIDAR
jgi:hypothetical protein